MGYLQYQLTNWIDKCWIVSGDLRTSIRLALSKSKTLELDKSSREKLQTKAICIYSRKTL